MTGRGGKKDIIKVRGKRWGKDGILTESQMKKNLIGKIEK